jgi:hypothetical protein
LAFEVGDDCQRLVELPFRGRVDYVRPSRRKGREDATRGRSIALGTIGPEPLKAAASASELR